MKQILVSNRDSAYILVDDEDYDRVNLYKWRLTRGGIISSVNQINGKFDVPLANFVMNDYKNLYDHRNRNSLDNQKYNLRIATKQQNMQNRRKFDKFDNSSKYKGVSKRLGSWQARISYNKKTIGLGSYPTEVEAANAYDVAARKYFGEFAVTNFAK